MDRRGKASEMNYAEHAIASGLTPGRLEWLLRNGCAAICGGFKKTRAAA